MAVKSSSSSSSSSWCARNSRGFPLVTAVYVVLVGLLLIWQGSNVMSSFSDGIAGSSIELLLTTSHQQQQQQHQQRGLINDRATSTTTSNTNPNALLLNMANPLGIPQGQALNLPSIRNVPDDTAEVAEVDKKRDIYGGTGDKAHLGGFTEIDMHGISPTVWKHMMLDYNVHSVLDVGCGRGLSTSWFQLHGADIMCVEGSHDAVQRSVLPPEFVVEHDFSRGPWWPEKTYDAVWAVEFLEHVGVNFHFNYITAFRKAALLFVTSSRWGGWHHVEVHPDAYWIRKYESYGFRYDANLTQQVRELATREHREQVMGPVGQKYYAQHVALSMKVFINPVVASLPEHAHLFFEHGCYQNHVQNKIVNRPCGTGRAGHLDSVIPPSFLPINLTEDMDQKWEELIRSNVRLPDITKKQK